ncbi:acyl-CoA dehydrogenase family protein [Nocardia sp. NBC_00511]|uniref:acyl-CoA dehydrogenase family protein n=1 Tax=Nocardia sp. NBC_00511 TaxID=2903591 RepID=UPI0030DE28F5
MDFEFTEAQRDLAGLARELLTDWAARHPRPDDTGFDPQLWRAMARAGLLDAALPERAGGGGFGLLEHCSILTEIGRTVAPAPYAATIAVAAATLAEFGSDAQLQRWMPSLLSGDKILAPVLAREFTCFEARSSADGWVLEGSQSVVAAGTFADAYLVEARVDTNSILLLVDRGDATVVPQHAVDGTDAARVEIRGATIPGEQAVTTPGAAAWARRRFALATCALQLGILERALELTCEYARTRKQFDKPIAAFQAVRQRLADAYIDVEAVRLTLWQAAWRESHGLPADSDIAVAKFWAAQSGHRVAHTAVHVHASAGIYLDYPMQRYFTAAKRAEFEQGTAADHLRGLGLALDSPAA